MTLKVEYFHSRKQKEKTRNIKSQKMLQRLPTALAQVKADNTSENLLNEIRQIIYLLHRAKEIAKKHTII